MEKMAQFHNQIKNALTTTVASTILKLTKYEPISQYVSSLILLCVFSFLFSPF